MAHSRPRWGMLSLAVALTVALALAAVISPASTARAQATASVSIVDFAFDPGTITVEAGTTVTWTNNGNAPHTVTADDGSFDSGNLDNGDTYSLTFDTPGTFSYYCAIHPEMTASVVVTAAAGDDDGGDDDGAADDDGTDTALPSTGVGAATLGGSLPTSLVLLGSLAVALGLMGLRLRRMA